jgi:hypothetical protein
MPSGRLTLLETYNDIRYQHEINLFKKTSVITGIGTERSNLFKKTSVITGIGTERSIEIPIKFIEQPDRIDYKGQSTIEKITSYYKVKYNISELYSNIKLKF